MTGGFRSVYIHIHIHTCIYTYTNTICKLIYIHIWEAHLEAGALCIYERRYMYIYMCVWTYTCKRTYICVWQVALEAHLEAGALCIYERRYMYICIYKYERIHINVHTFAHDRWLWRRIWKPEHYVYMSVDTCIYIYMNVYI
jgi:hypothetical protein